jgi:hypothetical protein
LKNSVDPIRAVALTDDGAVGRGGAATSGRSSLICDGFVFFHMFFTSSEKALILN